METMMFVLWFAGGFVFGSVPSGLWLVKAIQKYRQYQCFPYCWR